MKSFLSRRLLSSRRNQEWYMINQKRWYVYIVECVDGTLYTGVTTDVKRRLHEHNFTKKGAKYTASRRPVELVACKPIKSKKAAYRLEYQVKKKRKTEKIRFLLEVNDESL